MPPVEIDGNPITGATIDGTDVTEITVDGDTVFTAGPQVPDQSNVSFHLDASQESLSNNQTTTTVTDFSGNGNDFSGDSVIYKTNQINSLPAFEFNLDSLTNTQTISDPFTIGVVLSTDVDNQQHRFFGGTSNYGDFTLQNDTGQFGEDIFIAFGGAQIRFVPGSVPLNTFRTIVFEHNGTNGTIFLDGAQVLTGNLNSGSTTNLNLGTSVQNNSRGLQGRISELLVYDVSTNVPDLENYFQGRYGTF